MPRLRYVLTVLVLVVAAKLGLMLFSTYSDAASPADGSCPMASCIFDDTPDDD